MQVGRVETHLEGIRLEMMFLSDGTVVSGKIGPFDMRLEEEEIAKDFNAAVVDMLFEVPVDKSLGEPGSVESLVLKCSGFADFDFPRSHRQEVRKDADGAIILEIRSDSLDRPPQPLEPGEKEKYLSPTPSIQSTHPDIRELAERIAGNTGDPIAKAGRIQKWVFNNLTRTYKANSASAVRVLHNRAGDCTEHSLLFVSLARAVGIPARSVTGLAYANEDPPFFGWHEWAEIHDGTRWISVDPTWDQVLVDATHIRVHSDSKDSSWMNLLGQGLKLTVLEVVHAAIPQKSSQ